MWNIKITFISKFRPIAGLYNFVLITFENIYLKKKYFTLRLQIQRNHFFFLPLFMVLYYNIFLFLETNIWLFLLSGHLLTQTAFYTIVFMTIFTWVVNSSWLHSLLYIWEISTDFKWIFPIPCTLCRCSYIQFYQYL